jgi:diguanylate cyclase (GGDEF)-like protein
LTGLAEDATRGAPYSVLYPKGAINPERMADRLRQADDDGRSLDDGWRVRVDGSRFWGSVMIAPLEPSEPGATGSRSAFANEGCYALILRDISDKRHAAEQQRLANSADHLTGLFNRRAFFEAAELEIERGRRAPRRITLLMIDADRFKSINDAHGHGVGDAVLRDLAEVIASTVREIDTAARVGGEEFAVLLPSTDLLGAAALAARLCESIRQRVVRVDHVSVRYTVSVGVSTMPSEMIALDLLMKQADDALYEAKRCGRDRVAVSNGSEP